MLSKEQRLTKNSAFTATYKTRHSYRDEYLTLCVGREKTGNGLKNLTRIGFVVSKKNHKRAVKRNRLKRLMRASYRELFRQNSTFNTEKYMSLVFIAQDNAIDRDYETIK